MVCELVSQHDIEQARAFIAASGLAFDSAFDELLGIHEGGRLVATGARQGHVLKMLAVAPSHQNGPLLDELVTELIKRGYDAGFESFFVFTKPEYATTFEALTFSLLVSHGRVALLEYGHGLDRYLAAHRLLVRKGNNGAVVMNGNPFTSGHRYLVETAARQADHLYLFVVREDRSLFPFAERFRLIREGTRDLANVTVLDTSHYAISSVTFPTYFLKDGDPAASLQMEIDLILFARRLAPPFHIVRRFVGSEPYCATTAAYNTAMRRLLPPLGIEVTEVARRESAAGPISASLVREAMKNGDDALVAELVPETTLRFLRTAEGRALCAETEPYNRRH